MTTVLVLAILGFAAVSAAATDRSAVVANAAKMAASTLVIALLVVQDGAWTAYAGFVLAALLASWLGDLALTLPGGTAFAAGLSAFAVAHVLYIAGFVARGPMSIQWLAAGGIGTVAVIVVIWRWLYPHLPTDLRIPIAVYLVIVSTMVAAAFGTLGAHPDPRIPIAAVIFAFSDVLVARQRFVLHDRTNRIIGLPAYFVAQTLFALSR